MEGHINWPISAMQNVPKVQHPNELDLLKPAGRLYPIYFKATHEMLFLSPV